MMSVSLTDVQKIRRLPWLIAADTLNTGFFLLTFTGSVFILFLNEAIHSIGRLPPEPQKRVQRHFADSLSETLDKFESGNHRSLRLPQN